MPIQKKEWGYHCDVTDDDLRDYYPREEFQAFRCGICERGRITKNYDRKIREMIEKVQKTKAKVSAISDKLDKEKSRLALKKTKEQMKELELAKQNRDHIQNDLRALESQRKDEMERSRDIKWRRI